MRNIFNRACQVETQTIGRMITSGTNSPFTSRGIDTVTNIINWSLTAVLQ